MDGSIFDPESLINFGSEVLMAVGVPKGDSRLVSDSLVTADLWGHNSHGMLRLTWYVNRLKSGAMNTITSPEIVSSTGAVTVMDGHDGIGQVVASHACKLAADQAAQFAVGVVGVRNSNHFGTAAYWTRRLAEQGCIGLLITNGSPAMAPWGGREKTVGSNPWSIAAPTGSGSPAVLDIANTRVARGKIYAALQRGESVPEDWASDKDGHPTTDPREAIDGILAPMAEHKGYAIAFMMDMLSGVLTGSAYGTDVIGPFIPDKRSGCGHLALALRIDAFLGEDLFLARIDDLIGSNKSVSRAPDVDEIFYPGEIEHRSEFAQRRDGLLLPRLTCAELQKLGTLHGIPFPDRI